MQENPPAQSIFESTENKSCATPSQGGGWGGGVVGVQNSHARIHDSSVFHPLPLLQRENKMMYMGGLIQTLFIAHLSIFVHFTIIELWNVLSWKGLSKPI